MKFEKAREIFDARIEFVSLVDRAANRRRFLIAKAKGDDAGFAAGGRILKVDEESHYVTGIVYEPLVEDAQGDFMSAEEVRRAAHWFAKHSDRVDVQHSFRRAEGVFVVENYIAPCDMEIGGEQVRKGTWLMTAEVRNEQVWQAVLDGRITGFSMGGVGRYGREEADGMPVADGETNGLPQGAFDGRRRDGFRRKVAGLLRGEAIGRTEQTDEEVDEMTREEVQEMIDQSIENALRNLQKARAVATQLDEGQANGIEKQDGYFLKGLL